jgi:hypothetical protein
MRNPDVLCWDTTILVKIFVPYNAFEGNNSQIPCGPEIFLNPYVPAGMSSKFHSPGRIDPNFLKI